MNRVNGTSGPDVIVIGGGVIGCWTAHYLLGRGCSVRLIERDRIGSGASTGNCGYICPSHVLPLCGPTAIRNALFQMMRRDAALSIPFRWDPTLWRWLVKFAGHCNLGHQSRAAVARHELLKNSMALYRDYIDRSNNRHEWTDRGLLMVHRHAKTMDHFAVVAKNLLAEFGLQTTRHDGAAINKLEPGLVDGLAGGWWFPGDSHLDPGSLMRGLRHCIEAQGGDIRESVTVGDIVVEDGKVTKIQTDAGPMVADQYVLATGAETPRFAKSLGCQIPIVPGKGYSMTFPTSEHLPKIPMIFEDCHVAVTPLAGGFRVGSTMQLTGYNRVLDSKRVQSIRVNAQSYLRAPLVGSPTDVRSAWRPMVQDDLPCIDRCPAARNAIIAAGNGMIGLSTGTGTGELVAQMICDEETTIDPRPYRLNRFERHCKHPTATEPSSC